MTGGEKENGDRPGREEQERCDNLAEEENIPNETNTVTVLEGGEEEAVREGKEEEEKTAEECKKLNATQQPEKGEGFDTFEGNSAVEKTYQIQNIDLDTDDDDEEGKLVISEDPHEEDVVEKAELDKEIEELKEKDGDDTEEDDSKAQVSEELAEKESAFGFRFVNECLDEEGSETEEEAEELVVEADDRHDVEDSSPQEENGGNGEDLEKVLDEDKIEENTVEENITTGENQGDETDVQDLLEANLEWTEEKIHMDQDETDESESLLKRWQTNKRKRMGHHDRRVLAENASISKRPRRSCQFVKGYFGK